MKFKIIIIFFSLITYLSYAKDDTDSLEHILHREGLSQTKKIDILYDLLVKYRNVLPLKGIDYATSALKLVDNDQYLDSLYSFKLLNGIGDSYRYISQNEKAVGYYFKALRIAERQGNNRNKAIAYNNIGLVYNNVKDFKLALDFLKKSYNIFKNYNDKSLIIQSYNNIASIYWNAKEVDSAIKYYNMAFELSKSTNDVLGLLHSYNNLGVIYLWQGNNYLALEYFYRSLEISKDLNNRVGEAKTLNNLGQVFISLGKYNTAASNLEEALSIAKELNAKAIIADSYFYLAKLYEETDNYKLALEYNRKFNDAKDSIYNVEQSRRIQKLHEEYVLQKKNNRIKILEKDKELAQIITIASISLGILLIFIAILMFSKYRAKKKSNFMLTDLNTKLNDSNIQLQNINTIKDKIFTIIAHDLKNPLSGFKNITTVLADYYNDMNEQEIKESLTTIKEASNNLMLLLENLLTWAKLQQNEVEYHPEEFAINYLVKKYVDHYRAKANNKNIEIVLNNGQEVYAYADPNLLSIVIKNLVSNAIKYSYENGKVIINVENTNANATITVSDMGIGIEKEKLDSIFQFDNFKEPIFGTNGERGTGIGLILSKSVLDMNNGNIWLESKEGKGTTVTFNVPSKPNN